MGLGSLDFSLTSFRDGSQDPPMVTRQGTSSRRSSDGVDSSDFEHANTFGPDSHLGFRFH